MEAWWCTETQQHKQGDRWQAGKAAKLTDRDGHGLFWGWRKTKQRSCLCWDTLIATRPQLTLSQAWKDHQAHHLVSADNHTLSLVNTWCIPNAIGSPIDTKPDDIGLHHWSPAIPSPYWMTLHTLSHSWSSALATSTTTPTMWLNLLLQVEHNTMHLSL